MKVSLTFKTPDVIDDALSNVPENDQEKVKTILSRWVEYGEYLTVDFDTKAKTATVRETR